jgi:hypothetical protein
MPVIAAEPVQWHICHTQGTWVEPRSKPSSHWGVGFLLLRNTMSTYRRIVRRPQSRRRGCLVTLVVLVWVVLGLLLAYQYYLRPRISQQIGEQITRQLGAQPTNQPGQTTGDTSQPAAVPPAGVLPTLVAALPAGEIQITEAQANDYLLANIDRFNPIEAITLRFTPGLIEADMRALGSTSTARMGAELQNGQIIATNSSIDGPLANLVDLQDLVQPLQQQLNEELAAQGRSVTDVRIEQGVLVFVVE